jgi:hypothetical protein
MSTIEKEHFPQNDDRSKDEDCHPFGCNKTKLFWWLLKVLGHLSESTADFIFAFIHSPYFNISDTPRTFKELSSFEPNIKKLRGSGTN